MIELHAVVVGAGFAGLYMLHRLRQLGLSACLFEAGDGVGGTWYWNRYPGARCDSESFYYCYSFDDALAQEWEWSGRYPEQPEIERYLNHVSDRFALRRDIQLGTRVTSDEKSVVLIDTDSRCTVTFLLRRYVCTASARPTEYGSCESTTTTFLAFSFSTM